MEKDYQTKDLKPAKPKKDGEIFKDGAVFRFNWKGTTCGYLSKKVAEEGLKKVSGQAESKD